MRYVAVNGLNVIIIGLAAILVISLVKPLFARFYVRGLSELVGAI